MAMMKRRKWLIILTVVLGVIIIGIGTIFIVDFCTNTYQDQYVLWSGKSFPLPGRCRYESEGHQHYTFSTSLSPEQVEQFYADCTSRLQKGTRKGEPDTVVYYDPEQDIVYWLESISSSGNRTYFSVALDSKAYWIPDSE